MCVRTYSHARFLILKIVVCVSGDREEAVSVSDLRACVSVYKS
jgi:hypothetical protein